LIAWGRVARAPQLWQIIFCYTQRTVMAGYRA
jgi:hypothetical protein